MNKVLKFETESCSRCDGSGRHSYCSAYGTICFKCNGSGKQLTKKGMKAVEIYNSLITKPVAEIKVGDYYKDTFGKWRQVTLIEQDQYNLGMIIIHSKKSAYHVWETSTMVSVSNQEELDKAKTYAINQVEGAS